MDAAMMVTDHDMERASNSSSCSSGPTQALPSTGAMDAAMMVTDQNRDEASNSSSCSSGPTQALPSTSAMNAAVMMVTDQDRDEVRRLLTLYGSLKLAKRIDNTSIITTTTNSSRTNTSYSSSSNSFTSTTATRPVVHYTKERKTVGLSSQQITRLGYSQHTGKWRGFPYDSWSCCNSSGAMCGAETKLMAEEKVHSLLVRELPIERQQTAYRGTMLAVREQLSITGDVRRRRETMSASRRSLSKNINNNNKRNASLRRYDKTTGDTSIADEIYNSGMCRQAWLPTSPTRCTSFHRVS